MRFLLSIAVSVTLAACVLMPDSVSVGSRVDKYGRYDSTSITALYRNPWKPQRVKEEYITLEGGDANAESP